MAFWVVLFASLRNGSRAEASACGSNGWKAATRLGVSSIPSPVELLAENDGEEGRQGDQDRNTAAQTEEETSDSHHATNRVVSHRVPSSPVFVERVFHAVRWVSIPPSRRVCNGVVSGR